jgi:hypothetical protein
MVDALAALFNKSKISSNCPQFSFHLLRGTMVFLERAISRLGE